MNYRRGIEKVIDYLHSLGHRRLGFVGHHAMLGPINERMKAVMDAVARYPELEVRTAADADTLEGGRQAARALLGIRLPAHRHHLRQRHHGRRRARASCASAACASPRISP